MTLKQTVKEFNNITTEKCLIAIGDKGRIYFPCHNSYDSFTFHSQYHNKKATVISFNKDGGLDLSVENKPDIFNINPHVFIPEGVYTKIPL